MADGVGDSHLLLHPQSKSLRHDANATCGTRIDTARNIFENSYFGVYFGSQYGLFPASMAQVLGQPFLLVLPKIVNVIAGCFVLGVLLLRWLPLAIKERGRADQRATDLETLAAVDWLTGLYNRRHFETAGAGGAGPQPALYAADDRDDARHRPLQGRQ